MVRRILFTGPESTGKSTLAKALAKQYSTVWTPEYARHYLHHFGADYQKEDLLAIAGGQCQLEDAMLPFARDFLFCDTGMLVMKVWSEYRYGRCHPWILEQWAVRPYAHVFLCGIDLPWEASPYRENPKERGELYTIYRRELEASGRPFTELKGSLPERLTQVGEVLSNFRPA